MTAFAMPGPTELLIILGFLVVIFGARKIPELARAFGSSLGYFKAGVRESQKIIDADMREIEEEERERDRKLLEERVRSEIAAKEEVKADAV